MGASAQDGTEGAVDPGEVFFAGGFAAMKAERRYQQEGVDGAQDVFYRACKICNMEPWAASCTGCVSSV